MRGSPSIWEEDIQSLAFFSLKSVGLSERICFYASKEEKNGLDKLSGAGSEINGGTGQKIHRKMTKSALKLKMLRQKKFFFIFFIHSFFFFLNPPHIQIIFFIENLN